MKANIILAIVNSIIVIGFGFWWANNFETYKLSKGDESFLEIEFIGITTILASIVLKILNRKLSWLFVVIVPLLTAIFSSIITLFFPVTQLLRGTTLDDLRLYGIVHSILIILLSYLQLRFSYRHSS